MTDLEAQVDRLVGPTHHFGGLGVGNLASLAHQGTGSSPQAAAFQGLDKMAAVARRGVPQFVLPPHTRPDLATLERLGFGTARGNGDATGNVGVTASVDAITSGDAMGDVLGRAAAESPQLLSAVMSCSGMWMANAATVAASWDSPAGRMAVTIANLVSSLHRAGEAAETLADLRKLLPRQALIHAPLPGGYPFRDEGAANHMRFSGRRGMGRRGIRGQASPSGHVPGLHLFVYGDGDPGPRKLPSRQSLEASRAVARLHRLPVENVFFLKQHPDAIDAGAFHNDVVAASHGDLMIFHESAFFDPEPSLSRLTKRFRDCWGDEPRLLRVTADELPVDEAVACYLFNSQILSPPDSARPPIIICPAEAGESRRARPLIDRWVGEGIFSGAVFLSLDQSMSGGGGPACLRLRVPVTEAELAAFYGPARWSESLDERLRNLIAADYPDRLSPGDLADPALAAHARRINSRLRSLLLSAES